MSRAVSVAFTSARWFQDIEGTEKNGGGKSEGGKECCSGNVISGAEEKHMLQRFFGSRAVGAERFVNHAFLVEGGVEVGAIVADG